MSYRGKSKSSHGDQRKRNNSAYIYKASMTDKEKQDVFFQRQNERLERKFADRPASYYKDSEDFDHELVNGMKPFFSNNGATFNPNNDVENGAFIRNGIVDSFLNGRWKQSEEMYHRELAVAKRYMGDHFTDPFWVGHQLYDWDWKARAWKKATTGKYEDSRLG